MNKPKEEEEEGLKSVSMDIGKIFVFIEAKYSLESKKPENE
jgi:hypothetical protein